MSVGSRRELEGLSAAGRIAARALRRMREAVEPGITPAALNRIGTAVLRQAGARPAPILAAGFPAETCISVNDAVAHGIPDGRPLVEGDLVNLDVSVELDGYWADTGASLTVGPGRPGDRRLCETGKRALERALATVAPGVPLNRIGRAVESTARGAGYEVIRNLSGHGVGRALHEPPADVRGWYEPRDRRRMHAGMVLAVEPFVSTGARRVRVRPDGWTLATEDGGLAVQFEHTVVVTEAGALVVTAEDPYLVPREAG